MSKRTWHGDATAVSPLRERAAEINVSLTSLPVTTEAGPGDDESVALLDGGGEAYPRMLHAIAEARINIHLEVYAFSLFGVGQQFVEALSHASRRGVAVHVVIDGWGSARHGRTIADSLRHAGCHVRIHNRLVALLWGRFDRNHRKVLLVDDRVAFLGGINIGEENLDDDTRLGWADLAVEIRGEQCGRLAAMLGHHPSRSVNGSLRIYLSKLGGGWRLRRRYLKAFTSAQQRIHVAHGYFLPDAVVVRKIIAAARRGVEVHLLLAGQSDIPLVRMATRRLYARLLGAGVRICEWNESVLHAKVATIDGKLLLVGSFNLDPFSLVNLETLVEVDDPTVVGQGEAWIQDRFARSRQMLALDAATNRQTWLLGPLGRIVARLADALSRLIAKRRRRPSRFPNHERRPARREK